ncbi:hypothetical protein [Microvirga sp. P5_D2]
MADKGEDEGGSAGDEDPDEWDLPPKPKGMQWATYERWVARYDAAEEMLDAQLVMATARLMKRLCGWFSSIQPRLKKRLGKLQLPHNALMGNASLLQKGLDLLLGIVPRQPLLIAAF